MHDSGLKLTAGKQRMRAHRFRSGLGTRSHPVSFEVLSLAGQKVSPMTDLWHMAAPIISMLAVVAIATAARGDISAAKPPRIAVIIGDKPDDLERFAAGELCKYLVKLFGVRTRPLTVVPSSAKALLLVGRPESNPAIKQATLRRPFPKLSDQGLVLRRLQYRGRPALLIGGGSPRATLWAVYELAQRWGVRYLLHGDALPPRRAFRLPNVDLLMEPKLTVRTWRVINDFANGPESWGMRDYRPLVDQLAKLKFTRLFLSVWVWQPFLHLEIGGIKQQQAWLWYDYHYPITDDMIGRRLFGDGKEFWNPDLPLGASYNDFAAAGERFVHSLIDCAHQRGIECAMTVAPTEFPREFTPLVPKAQKVHQLGEMTIVPGAEAEVTDPALTSLSAAVLKTAVNTYPELDYIFLGMPEWRQWAGQYERAWRELDAKYRIESIRPLKDVIAAAQARTDYPGGADRAVAEAKGDIVALRFYDHLLRDIRVLDNSRRPNIKVIFGAVAEELFPVLPRILPAGCETMDFIDYTPSRVVRRREALRQKRGGRIPRTLIYTLEDDNVGVMPQLTTGSLHELTKDLRRYGWAGFSTRYWEVTDHDPCVAYIARAAWDADLTPQEAYRDQVRAVCGNACVDDMLTVFREVEAVTVGLEWHGLGFSFPVPGMMMNNWNPSPMPPDLVQDRQGYQRALDAARRAQGKAKREGKYYVDYWVGRLEFAVGYLDTVESVHNAAMAESQGKADQAARYANQAVDRARRALESYARVARDQSDRGAIAVMNEFVYRPLKAKAAELARR
jgi:hypothetical protein